MLTKYVQLVFAHCDLLSANIIIHREAGQELSVSFIDYEYATPSPAAFDISNHFAEFAGYDCDYSAIPTRSQRHAFIREYIAAYAKLSDAAMDVQEETDKLMREVDVFRGVPGFYWGIWALIQATISHIAFDYASYAELRLGEYWAYKAEVDGSREKKGEEKPLREKTWSRSE
jgi:ethanolamine kinase